MSESWLAASSSVPVGSSAKFRGVAPSGRERVASVLAVYRIERGRIVEGWGTLSWD